MLGTFERKTIAYYLKENNNCVGCKGLCKYRMGGVAELVASII